MTTKPRQGRPRMDFDYRYKSDRLTNAERRELLTLVEATEKPVDCRNRRDGRRLSYRRTHVTCVISQQGNATIECTVPTRDLSAGGLSFIYWGFLHQRTRCRCTLITADGRPHEVSGEVTWCRHLSGPNHLVGIRFVRPINPELFLDRQDRPAGKGAGAAAEVDPKGLSGRVLVISGNDLDRRLLVRQLAQTAVEFTCVGRTEEAVDVVGKQAFDLVLCDIRPGDDAGEQSLVAIRMTDSHARFVAMTPEREPHRHRRFRDAGAQDILVKPYTPAQLYAALWRGLFDEDASVTADLGGGEKVHSTMVGQGMDDLIEDFVTEAWAAGRELRRACDVRDSDAIRTRALMLRGTAASVGFPQVTDVATRVVEMLDAEPKGTGDVGPLVRQLCGLCDRLAPVRDRAA